MSAKLRGGKVGSINRLKKSLKKSSGGNALTNIGAEGILVRFLTEPDEWVEFYEHYDEGAKQFVLCTDDCDLCRDGIRASKRYLANAVDVEEGKAIALKMPVTAASQVTKKYDRYNTLLDRDYSILREGQGIDTEYDVNPEAPSRFNLNKYEQFDLWDVLSKLLSSQQDSDDDDDEDEDEAPARRSRSKGRTAPPTRRKVKVLDDDDEEDELPPTKRRTVSKRRVVKR